MEVEYLHTSAAYDSIPKWNYYYGGVPSGCHWRLKFRSLPVSLGYEKRVIINRRRISPFYHAGASILYSTIESHAWSYNQPLT